MPNAATKPPLLVLRVGYMQRYDGPDEISGGGEYVRRNGVGGEVFNFKQSRGKYYGYAMSRHFAGIRLDFLQPGTTWQRGDELHGVDVVFIARRPGHGQVVIGWYRNATVLHKEYRIRRGIIREMDQPRKYLCFTDASQGVLLPEEQRTLVVPSAPTGAKGFPGQSNVWYPELHNDRRSVCMFVDQLRRYIESASLGAPTTRSETRQNGSNGRSGHPDHAHNAAVEKAAVDFVSAYFEAEGYSLTSVERDCVGWDLTATKGRTTLRVEVKGMTEDTVRFELTPNEYVRLQEHGPNYRVCIVLEALANPRMFELIPTRPGTQKPWQLVTKDRDLIVELEPRIAAVGREITL